MIRLSRPQSRAGFTLVELMVVITIIIIMSVITYAPYNYYSNRAKVRIGAETIEQILNRARLLSVNGHLFPGTKQNAHVGVVFTPHSNAPDILLFPYVS
jgi:prepilin-type N-terminal cleavage/methylation domain-containing protein